MFCTRLLRRSMLVLASISNNGARRFAILRDESGSALLEFAITLPLLVVFAVGIFDFSGAFNQKQKLAQAAQEGAVVAAAQPTSDMQISNADPDSLRAVVTVVFNNLAGSGVLPQANQGGCKAVNATASPSGTTLQWTYAISGCPDNLTVLINRGWTPGVPAGTSTTVGTLLTVTYPYRWHFNSVIQLLIPGATYSATTFLNETAKVHNQL
jgi:Flp pilus assembly protein TadG